MVMRIIKSKLTFVNRISFYINDFFLKFHSLICYFLSEFKMWCFSGQFIALSLESVRAKYSRAIMVVNYFYPKVEAGKVSGFVCLSESVVQFVIDSLPPIWSCSS